MTSRKEFSWRWCSRWLARDPTEPVAPSTARASGVPAAVRFVFFSILGLRPCSVGLRRNGPEAEIGPEADGKQAKADEETDHREQRDRGARMDVAVVGVQQDVDESEHAETEESGPGHGAP